MRKSRTERWQSPVPISCQRCTQPATTGLRYRGKLLCLDCTPKAAKTRAILSSRPRFLAANGKRRMCGQRWRERTKPGILARDGATCIWRIIGMPFSPACCASGCYVPDHVQPWHLGLTDEHDPLNLISACVECNVARSNTRVAPDVEAAVLLVARIRTNAMAGYRW